MLKKVLNKFICQITKRPEIFYHDVTTVPLSVSYRGAKPLGPWVRTSTFLPCGSQVGHARGVRGPKSTVPSSAILMGSVAVERSYRAFGASIPNYSILGGGECSLSVLGPMLVPMFFPFY